MTEQEARAEASAEAKKRWPDNPDYDATRIKLGRLAFVEGSAWERARLSSRVVEAAPSKCTCGWGGQHDPDNPRCDAFEAAPPDSDLIDRLKRAGENPEVYDIEKPVADLFNEAATAVAALMDERDSYSPESVAYLLEKAIRATLTAALGGGDRAE
jgi:hypothetical protein